MGKNNLIHRCGNCTTRGSSSIDNNRINGFLLSFSSGPSRITTSAFRFSKTDLSVFAARMGVSPGPGFAVQHGLSSSMELCTATSLVPIGSTLCAQKQRLGSVSATTLGLFYRRRSFVFVTISRLSKSKHLSLSTNIVNTNALCNEH